MAKKSSVQVTATVTGDGISSVTSPTPTVNATTAPAGGSRSHTLAAATPQLFTPPTPTTVGVIIQPIPLDVSLSDSAGLGAIPIAGLVATFLSLVAPSAGFTLTSPTGGEVFIQWV